jgi:diguanylate cyclase (GGDEF)-like protein
LGWNDADMTGPRSSGSSAISTVPGAGPALSGTGNGSRRPDRGDGGGRIRKRDKTRAIAGERYAASNRWFWISTSIGAVAVLFFLAAAIPTYGWTPFIVLGIPAIAGCFVHRIADLVTERMYAISHLGWLALVGVCAAQTGGADSFLLPLVPTMALGFFGRLRPLVATAYAWVGCALAGGAVLLADWDGFVRFPWLVGSCALGLLTLTLFASQMAAGEIRHRGEATVDQLTGLLNRRGLKERMAELKQQAQVIGDGTYLAVLACDLDRFKLINDTYGHARGDAVLRDVAYIIRKQLRRFELAYRMGGEEFLILLPGNGVEDAAVVAEAVRAAIADSSPGGLQITISVGIAAAVAADFDADQLLLAADHAMMSAKRAGRDRIVLATEARRVIARGAGSTVGARTAV